MAITTNDNPITNLKAAYDLLTTVCMDMANAGRGDDETIRVFEARRQMATALETLGGLE